MLFLLLLLLLFLFLQLLLFLFLLLLFLPLPLLLFLFLLLFPPLLPLLLILLWYCTAICSGGGSHPPVTLRHQMPKLPAAAHQRFQLSLVRGSENVMPIVERCGHEPRCVLHVVQTRESSATDDQGVLQTAMHPC